MPVVKTKYFREAFDSAISQTFDDYEIVVLNNKADGDISYVKSHPKVRYFETQNRICARDNWNNGIDISQGEFICFLSDDDIFHENCLRELNDFFRQYDCDICLIRQKMINETGNLISIDACGCQVETFSEIIYNLTKFSRWTGLPNSCYRKSCALEVGKFWNKSDIWFADEILSFQIGLLKNRFGFLNKPYISYRQTEQSNAKIFDIYAINDHIEGWRCRFSFVNEELEKHKGEFTTIAKYEFNLSFRRSMLSLLYKILNSHGARILWKIYKESNLRKHLSKREVKVHIFHFYRKKLLLSFHNFISHLLTQKK